MLRAFIHLMSVQSGQFRTKFRPKKNCRCLSVTWPGIGSTICLKGTIPCCTAVKTSKSTLLEFDNFISKVTLFWYRNVPLSDPCFVIGTTSSLAVAEKDVENSKNVSPGGSCCQWPKSQNIFLDGQSYDSSQFTVESKFQSIHLEQLNY